MVNVLVMCVLPVKMLANVEMEIDPGVGVGTGWWWIGANGGRDAWVEVVCVGRVCVVSMSPSEMCPKTDSKCNLSIMIR